MTHIRLTILIHSFRLRRGGIGLGQNPQPKGGTCKILRLPPF